MPPVGEYHDNIEEAMAAGLAFAGSRGHQRSLFNRAAWFWLLDRHALADGKACAIRARWNGADTWLLLMSDGPRRARSLSNWYSFSFEPLCGGEPCAILRPMLVDAIARKARDLFDRVTLEPMPDDNGIATRTARAFEKAGWFVEREQCDVNHILNVDGRSFAEYWSARPGRLRSTVKRKAKKNIVELRIETEFSERDWAAYEAVYAQSWKPEEGSPEFLKALASNEGAAGALRLGLAFIDGKPVAAQFWTVENGVALIHKLAHVEDDARASPGTLLTHKLFEHVIEADKVALIDFGTGDDPYKRDWMEEVRPRYRLTCMRRRAPGNWREIFKAKWRGLAARRAAD